MLIELVISIYSVFVGQFFEKVILILVVLIWLSTFFIQVPIHQKLLVKKDFFLIEKLNRTNWIRTILWSIKIVLVV